MEEKNNIYSINELFKLQRDEYPGYRIIELKYNEHSSRRDRYKIVECISDACEHTDEHSLCLSEGIIFIEMVK